MFLRQRNSYLSWAVANDEDLYRRQRDEFGAREQRREKPKPPELFEWSWELDALASLFALLQTNIHYTATHGTKAAKKKPKVKRWPSPVTAAQRVKRAEAIAAFEHVESVLVFRDCGGEPSHGDVSDGG